MRTLVVDLQTAHFRGFFDADWRPLSHEVSFGHDIEGSWLTVEAASALNDVRVLEEVKALAVRMADAVWKEGVDSDYGVMNEGLDGVIVHGGKDRWPQAEAVVGLINAYEITGDVVYLERARFVWAFISIVDRRHGEWHGRLERTEEPKIANRADAWNCPYHNTRACIEVIERLRAPSR